MVTRQSIKLNLMTPFICRMSHRVVAWCVGAYCNTPLRDPNNHVVLGVFETMGLQPCR